MASNYIRDGCAAALQKPLAEAGYILPSTKLDTELEGVLDCHAGILPFDLSFRPDPNPAPNAPETCPYAIIGGDVTISSTPPIVNVLGTSDAIETATAAAEKHLQSRERRKLVREKSWNIATNAYVHSEQVMRELVDKETALIPMAIDPLGRWGPLMRGFLYQEYPRHPMTFHADKVQAKRMYERILQYPCPRGVVTTASINWRHNKRRKFFGHSYTAPTPKEYTMQQIGLSVTKAYALHLRKASKNFSYPPVNNLGIHPPGFGLSDSQFSIDEASVS
jgi:hypothetical protein